MPFRIPREAIQGLVGASSWGFKSPLRHLDELIRDRGFSSGSLVFVMVPTGGFERVRGADEKEESATLRSASAPKTAAKADGLAGRGSGGQIPPSVSRPEQLGPRIPEVSLEP